MIFNVTLHLPSSSRLCEENPNSTPSFPTWINALSVTSIHWGCAYESTTSGRKSSGCRSCSWWPRLRSLNFKSHDGVLGRGRPFGLDVQNCKLNWLISDSCGSLYISLENECGPGCCSELNWDRAESFAGFVWTIEAGFSWSQSFHHLHRLSIPLDQAGTTFVPTPSKMVSTKTLQEHPPAESFLSQIVTEALSAKKIEIDNAAAKALKVISHNIDFSSILTKNLGKSRIQGPCRERAWEDLTSYSPWTGEVGESFGKRWRQQIMGWICRESSGGGSRIWNLASKQTGKITKMCIDELGRQLTKCLEDAE